MISVDPETKKADITLSYTGITPSAAHVHAGAPGVTGPVALQIGTPVANKYSVKAVQLTDAQLADFRSKAWYFNIPTTALPAGEIRGQIGYQVRISTMSGLQENPPVTSASTGVGYLAYDPDTKNAFGKLTVANFTPTNAHVHRGAAGVNGPVAIPFQALAGAPLSWTTNGMVALTDADAILLFNQGLYTNAHSALFPGGEVRGQLVGNP